MTLSHLLCGPAGSTFEVNRKDLVRTKVSFALILAVAVVAVIVAGRHPRSQPASPDLLEPDVQLSSEDSPSSAISETVPPSPPVVARAKETTVASVPAGKPPITTNKLERLSQIREMFVRLAAGDPTAALRAAKQITDETERETALLTLVTEWTHGELGPARRRAQAIDTYGLEAGLAIELANKPELALLWANELTEGPGRAAILQRAAIAMVGSDPAAAFALSEQLPADDRRNFFDSVFAGWGGADTDAALKWADELPDPAERDAAIQAIRTAAPVGIGAVLKMEDGYAVINQLMPGTPAALSGQIHPGDRIVALAQGDNAFVDARGLPLAQIVEKVRGAPYSVLKLQVLSADAPPNSAPRIVTLSRDQIRFKQ